MLPLIRLKRCKSPSVLLNYLFSPLTIPTGERSAANACILPAGERFAPSPYDAASELAAHRLSLLASLARRGLLSTARDVAERIITGSAPAEAATAFDCAVSLGVPIELGRFLRTLVAGGQLLKADTLFNHIRKGTAPDDPSVLNSMIECYCRMGNLFLAETYLNELVNVGFLPATRAYVAVLRAYCAEKKYLEGFNLLCMMAVQEGILPPLSVYDLLISGLCYRGYFEHARYLFDFMSHLGLQLRPRSYKYLVLGFLKENRVVEAEDVCKMMESRGGQMDLALCTSLMKGYLNEGRIELALKFFGRMKDIHGCEPDTFAYNTIIHGFLKFGYVDSAWNLVKQMEVVGLKRNVVTYDMMISWYCKNRRVGQAMDLINEMTKSDLAPNLHCYTALITALCMERRLRDAEELFDKMLENGIIPDHEMFLLLIKNFPVGHKPMVIKKTLLAIAKIEGGTDTLTFSCLSTFCNQRLQGETEVLLDEIMKSDSFPIQLIFNVLISIFCVEGKLDVACMLMEKIVSWGYKLSVSAYNFLTSYICKEGQLDDAGSHVSHFIHQRGLLPSLATYSIKLNALCKVGCVDVALEQLDQMIQQDFKPTVAIYDSIIGSLCKEGRMKEADITFNNMLNTGILPDEVVYATLIKGFSNSRKAVRACSLFDQLLQHGLLPSSRAYSVLINGLIKKNLFSMAFYYLDRMLEDGFAPGTVLFTVLVNQFFRKGEVRLALYIFDLMVRSLVEPDLIAYGSLISGLCRSNWRGRKPVLARKLKKARYVLHRLESRRIIMSKMISNPRKPCRTIQHKVDLAFEKMLELRYIGLQPDLYIYNSIINGLCRANRMEDAYKQIDEMLGEGITPNQVTFTILMRSYIRFGDVDHAVGLFNQMNSNGCNPDRLSYNTLIVGFCVASRVIEALSLAHGMQKRGLFANKVSYNKILQCLISCNSNNLAIKLLEEMISLNHVPYSTNYSRLLWLLSRRNNLSEFRRVYNLMNKIGRMPDEETKRQLLNRLYGLGEFGMASEIKENMPIGDV